MKLWVSSNVIPLHCSHTFRYCDQLIWIMKGYKALLNYSFHFVYMFAFDFIMLRNDNWNDELKESYYSSQRRLSSNIKCLRWQRSMTLNNSIKVQKCNKMWKEIIWYFAPTVVPSVCANRSQWRQRWELDTWDLWGENSYLSSLNVDGR